MSSDVMGSTYSRVGETQHQWSFKRQNGGCWLWRHFLKCSAEGIWLGGFVCNLGKCSAQEAEYSVLWSSSSKGALYGKNDH